MLQDARLDVHLLRVGHALASGIAEHDSVLAARPFGGASFEQFVEQNHRIDAAQKLLVADNRRGIFNGEMAKIIAEWMRISAARRLSRQAHHPFLIGKWCAAAFNDFERARTRRMAHDLEIRLHPQHVGDVARFNGALARDTIKFFR